MTVETPYLWVHLLLFHVSKAAQLFCNIVEVVLSFIPPPAVLKKANALSFSRSLRSLSDKTAM